MKKSIIKYILPALITSFTLQTTLAQDNSATLKKEVEVVKAYEPSVSDAYKINDIPQIKQENTTKPTFEYQINPQPVFSSFASEPVEAAVMAREPKTEMGKGLLKAGVGSYKTPYGELFFNTEAGRNTTFGMHFKHLSSGGKIKLLNGDKVDAPQSENIAELFTNHYFRNSTLSTNIFFNRQSFRYYGYTGDTLSNAVKEELFPYWNKQQAFTKGGLKIKLGSNDSPTDHFRYNTQFKYQVLGSSTGQKEHMAELEGSFKKELESFWGQLDVGFIFLHTDSVFVDAKDTFGSTQQIILELSPSILLEGETARLEAGINSFSVMDEEDEYLLTPNIKAEWSPVENVMTLFAGVDGHLEHNQYSAIVSENKYFTPTQNIESSKYRYILNAGIRGKFSPRFNYKFGVDYADISNQHFYVLKETITSGYLATYQSRSNTFDVLYDNIKQLTLGGELHYAASDVMDILLKGKYYSYEMKTLDEPWQKPNFEASASISFNPDGPLRFTTDIFAVGGRKSLIQTNEYNVNLYSSDLIQVSNDIISLDPIIDLNFGIEYQYSPGLSFWGQVNNFSFTKYENWVGYTNRGITVLVGASLSF